jgi:hypothetical protein
VVDVKEVTWIFETQKEGVSHFVASNTVKLFTDSDIAHVAVRFVINPEKGYEEIIEAILGGVRIEPADKYRPDNTVYYEEISLPVSDEGYARMQALAKVLLNKPYGLGTDCPAVALAEHSVEAANELSAWMERVGIDTTICSELGTDFAREEWPDLLCGMRSGIVSPIRLRNTLTTWKKYLEEHC